MTPKQKAKEMVEYFSPYADYQECDLFTQRQNMEINAINCARLSVNEIINCDSYFKTLEDSKEFSKYWSDVQKEINLL